MFIPTIKSYALLINRLELKISKTKDNIKSLKLNFPNLVANYLQNHILNNIDNTLKFRYKNLDLEVYNKDIKILKIKIIYNNNWGIKYKLTKLYYEGNIDTNNLSISSKIIESFESIKKDIFSFISKELVQSKINIGKEINNLKLIEDKINHSQTLFSFFIFHHLKDKLSKPPYTITFPYDQLLKNHYSDTSNGKFPSIFYPHVLSIKANNFNFHDTDIEYEVPFELPSKPASCIELVILKKEKKESKNQIFSYSKPTKTKTDFQQFFFKQSIFNVYKSKFFKYV